jgi:hypothetical protein
MSMNHRHLYPLQIDPIEASLGILEYLSIQVSTRSTSSTTNELTSNTTNTKTTATTTNIQYQKENDDNEQYNENNNNNNNTNNRMLYTEYIDGFTAISKGRFPDFIVREGTVVNYYFFENKNWNSNWKCVYSYVFF